MLPVISVAPSWLISFFTHDFRQKYHRYSPPKIKMCLADKGENCGSECRGMRRSSGTGNGSSDNRKPVWKRQREDSHSISSPFFSSPLIPCLFLPLLRLLFAPPLSASKCTQSSQCVVCGGLRLLIYSYEEHESKSAAAPAQKPCFCVNVWCLLRFSSYQPTSALTSEDLRLQLLHYLQFFNVQIENCAPQLSNCISGWQAFFRHSRKSTFEQRSGIIRDADHTKPAGLFSLLDRSYLLYSTMPSSSRRTFGLKQLLNFLNIKWHAKPANVFIL